jgi:hypothetical protein
MKYISDFSISYWRGSLSMDRVNGAHALSVTLAKRFTKLRKICADSAYIDSMAPTPNTIALTWKFVKHPEDLYGFQVVVAT